MWACGTCHACMYFSPNVADIGLVLVHGMMRVAPSVGCWNMSCYDVATLGRGSRLIRSRLRRVLLAYTLPHSLRASLPKC